MASVTLRPVTPPDAGFLASLYNDDEYAFFAIDQVPGAQELAAQIAEADLPTVDFRIACDPQGEPVGWVRVDTDPDNGLARMAYGVARRYWGQGYASAAVLLLVDESFKDTALHKLWARVDPRNRRSVGVLERAGFTLEGRLESHFVRRGERVDRLMFGLTRDRWVANAGHVP
jgi:RimJ/RimL family protein N-acetyltransferase